MDLASRVTYNINEGGTRRDGTCIRGYNKKPYNVYFLVIIYIPSFSNEQAMRGAGLPDIGSMQVDPKREDDRLSSS